MEMNDREEFNVKNEQVKTKTSNGFFKTLGILVLSLALAVFTVLVINL